MILSKKTIEHFQSFSSLVTKVMKEKNTKYPYEIPNNLFLRTYECLRLVWVGNASVKEACDRFNLARNFYYTKEKDFIKYGVNELFLLPFIAKQFNNLEELLLLAKRARPALSYTALHRFVEAIPLTHGQSSIKLVSQILQSHGYGLSGMSSDPDFWGRIQRILTVCFSPTRKNIEGRDPQNKKSTFFNQKDGTQNRLELLRQTHFHPNDNVKDTCACYKVSPVSFYQLLADYKVHGPWAFIPAFSYGKDGLSSELQISIILNKLRYPSVSAEVLGNKMSLDVSRHAIQRVIKRWNLGDKTRTPIALNEFVEIKQITLETKAPPGLQKSAFHMLSEKEILSSRRINRHFELICHKVATSVVHLCDPGALLLAPFVNDLGIIQAFETYGPTKLRGKEITNLALLNIFRILTGYRRINHLSNNKDRTVALASGIGMYGSTSRFYENTISFTFEQLHHLRMDLVKRAKELGLIEGIQVGMDFHFKEFYGKDPEQKQIGQGPNKAKNMVAGFRPHLAWDLANNVIINMAYFQGATRAPRILQQFCEQNLFSILDPKAIEEIYLDSEYTKEGDFQYLKQACVNSQLFVCLKRNPQIKKLIKSTLEEKQNWQPYTQKDEIKKIQVQLPKTGLDLLIVILREQETKTNIRCFASTQLDLTKEEILQKYRHRWVIENGIKDLVGNYYLDEIFGEDPEKVEFEFYCIMVARLAYEYFLKELGEEYLKDVKGNKLTIQKMRNLLLEKKNCTLGVVPSGNFQLTFLDSPNPSLMDQVSKMFENLERKEKNKVLWWNQRGLEVKFKNQFDFL